MVIFINGSINSGKTTTSRLLAEKLKAQFIDFDDIRHSMPELSLDQAMPLVISKGIDKINILTDAGAIVVANYIITENDYHIFENRLKTNQKHFVTLSPKIEVALSNRGNRILDQQDLDRIMHHYEIGIPNPSFGIIIDNSELTIEQTVDKIIKNLDI